MTASQRTAASTSLCVSLLSVSSIVFIVCSVNAASRFSGDMLARLDENSDTGRDDPYALFTELLSEVVELHEAISYNPLSPTTAANVRTKAAHVANRAMMIADAVEARS